MCARLSERFMDHQSQSESKADQFHALSPSCFNARSVQRQRHTLSISHTLTLDAGFTCALCAPLFSLLLSSRDRYSLQHALSLAWPNVSCEGGGEGVSQAVLVVFVIACKITCKQGETRAAAADAAWQTRNSLSSSRAADAFSWCR